MAAGLNAIGVLIACALFTLAVASPPSAPTALPDGTVRMSASVNGVSFAGRVVNGVSQWNSIRYAEPPVNDLRWAPPVPLASYGSAGTVIDAQPPRSGAAGDGLSRVCMQPPTDTRNPYSLHPPYVNASEDCLFLNVYAPAPTTPATNPLPVMVYFHGGEFAFGSGTADYDPSNLVYNSMLMPSKSQSTVAGGVVVVTINYRLGVFGFLVTQSLSKTGTGVNFGLQDQQTALRWVQQYISAFGGDPNQVCLFGSGSGGSSVVTHLLMRASWPLFSRVIVQSASGGLVWDGMLSVSRAIQASHDLVNAAGCGGVSPQIELACLRNTSRNNATVLLALASATTEQWLSLSRVVIDGVQLNDTLANLVATSAFAGATSLVKPDVTIMLGHNDVEGHLRAYETAGVFSGGQDRWLSALTQLQFNAALSNQFPTVPGPNPVTGSSGAPIDSNSTRDSILGMYSKQYPSDPSSPAAPSQYWSIYSRLEAAYMTTCGTFDLSRYLMYQPRLIPFVPSVWTAAPVFRYVFTRPTANSAIAVMNATHGTELPYIFGWSVTTSITTNQSIQSFTIADPFYNTQLSQSAGEIALSQQMQGYWVQFAGTGNPNVGTVSSDSPSIFPVGYWPYFRGSTEYLMQLDVNTYQAGQGSGCNRFPFLFDSNRWYSQCFDWRQYFGYNNTERVDVELWSYAPGLPGTWSGTLQVSGELASCAASSVWALAQETATITQTTTFAPVVPGGSAPAPVTSQSLVYDLTGPTDVLRVASTYDATGSFQSRCVVWSMGDDGTLTAQWNLGSSPDCPISAATGLPGVQPIQPGAMPCGSAVNAAVLSGYVTFIGSCTDGACLPVSNPVDTTARAAILVAGFGALALYLAWYKWCYLPAKEKETREQQLLAGGGAQMSSSALAAPSNSDGVSYQTAAKMVDQSDNKVYQLI